jgi:hypothetical protein
MPYAVIAAIVATRADQRGRMTIGPLSRDYSAPYTQEMKLIDEQFTDLTGRKHTRYTVHSVGQGCFMPLDNFTNSCPLPNGDRMFRSAKEAWDWLRHTEVKS